MNRGLNLPQIQKIMTEFEKESSMMDMKEEMMSDAIDDVMDDELEDEEEEGDKILKEVLDEIGVSLSQQVLRHSLRLHNPANASFNSFWTLLRASQLRRRSQNGDRSLWAKVVELLPIIHQDPQAVRLISAVEECRTKMPFKLVWTLCEGHELFVPLECAIRRRFW